MFGRMIHTGMIDWLSRTTRVRPRPNRDVGGHLIEVIKYRRRASARQVQGGPRKRPGGRHPQVLLVLGDFSATVPDSNITRPDSFDLDALLNAFTLRRAAPGESKRDDRSAAPLTGKHPLCRMSTMRVTGPLIRVLLALLEEPHRELYGLAILRATRLKSGTMYPLLERLETLGWVASRWEDADPSEKGRPRRRFYRLSALGVHEGRQLLIEHGVGGVAWTS